MFVIAHVLFVYVKCRIQVLQKLDEHFKQWVRRCAIQKVCNRTLYCFLVGQSVRTNLLVTVISSGLELHMNNMLRLASAGSPGACGLDRWQVVHIRLVQAWRLYQRCAPFPNSHIPTVPPILRVRKSNVLFCSLVSYFYCEGQQF